jgi:hypothetical protein
VKIYDVFPFRDELDMLECRLVQFSDFPVWRHVLVEAAADHRGNPKPLVFAENRERFAPWADQIVHVVADGLPAMTGADPFEREAAQRDAASAGLADADPDDWLILADVDEIPNEAAMARVRGGEQGLLGMTLCCFAVDWVWGQMGASVICPAAGSADRVSRTRRDGWAWRQFPGCGHHLSWLGGQEGIAAKTAAHCHAECDPDLIAANADDSLYRKGVNPFGRIRSGFSGPPGLTPVDVDGSWPRWVCERRCPDNWFRPREAPA